MVVSDSGAASHVGATTLAAGGNAVDAAVATAFALAVALPEAGNLGGGGFAVVRSAEGQSFALDFRETAPGGASRDMYLDAAGKPTPESVNGPRASGVPGSVAGLYALHQRLGRKPWRSLVEPAIELAEDGFVVDERLANGIRAAMPRLARSPASAAVFLPGGAPPVVGSTFRQPELARTLRRIAERGAAGFYYGETADLIATDMRKLGGLITAADLAAYQARWRAPLDIPYRGHHLVAMPLPSSGGIVVGQIAKILEAWDLRQLGWHSVDHLTLVAEAEQRAFADRNALLGDPDFTPARPQLLDDSYLEERRGTMDPFHATPSTDVRPGLAEGNDTTHLGVVDADGSAVALTTTLNELYGSGVTIAGVGILMNDEMDDFAARPGTPNLYGLVQGEANRIEPGKRPLSSMSPILVIDGAGADGRVLAVIGARGGGRIISATFQVLSNIVDFGMGAAAAVSAPRIHHQHQPDLLFYEPDGLGAAALEGLEGRGFHLQRLGVIASAPAIVRVSARWTGFADPRRGGGAEGN